MVPGICWFGLSLIWTFVVCLGFALPRGLLIINHQLCLTVCVIVGRESWIYCYYWKHIFKKSSTVHVVWIFRSNSFGKDQLYVPLVLFFLHVSTNKHMCTQSHRLMAFPLGGGLDHWSPFICASVRSCGCRQSGVPKNNEIVEWISINNSIR